MSTLIIITVGILIMLSYVLAFRYYAKRSDKRFDTLYSHIGLSRSNIEDAVYGNTNRLTRSADNYVDVNHLFITNGGDKLMISQSVANYSFFEDLGIDFAKLAVNESQIMCLMPFHKSYNRVYKKIQQAAKETGFHLLRSDSEFVAGEILKHTINLILQSELVIAVLDGRNPNVFYEIGIAHSVGKSVLLLSDSSHFDKIPFDVSANRILFYSNLEELRKGLVTKLKQVKDAK